MAGISAQHFFQSRFDQNGSNQEVEKEKHTCNQPYRRVVPAIPPSRSSLSPRTIRHPADQTAIRRRPLSWRKHHESITPAAMRQKSMPSAKADKVFPVRDTSCRSKIENNGNYRTIASRYQPEAESKMKQHQTQGNHRHAGRQTVNGFVSVGITLGGGQ